MSLSQRLKAAEYDRRLAAGLPVDHLDRPGEPGQAPVQLDVRQPGDPVIDLTQSDWADVIELGQPPQAPTAPPRPTGDSPSSVETSAPPGSGGPDDVSVAGPQVGERSRLECPHCGGPTQIDLVDTVGHTISLSCLSCYHMFRVEA